jgi:hypothetical protein
MGLSQPEDWRGLALFRFADIFVPGGKYSGIDRLAGICYGKATGPRWMPMALPLACSIRHAQVNTMQDGNAYMTAQGKAHGVVVQM